VERPDEADRLKEAVFVATSPDSFEGADVDMPDHKWLYSFGQYTLCGYCLFFLFLFLFLDPRCALTDWWGVVSRASGASGEFRLAGHQEPSFSRKTIGWWSVSSLRAVVRCDGSIKEACGAAKLEVGRALKRVRQENKLKRRRNEIKSGVYAGEESKEHGHFNGADLD
jgi:hypothetical protein